MDKSDQKKPFLKKLREALLEILAELVTLVLFIAIGSGILVLLGNQNVLETVDPDVLVLLGALVVLAAFGIMFAVIAAVRKKTRKTE